MNKVDKLHKALSEQMLFFITAFHIADLGAWTFFVILLFKETNSFTVLTIEYVIYLTVLWVGFLVGSFSIDRLGYLKTLRISFFLMMLASIATFFSIGNLATLYIPLALLRGFPRGLFWVVSHNYNLREIHGVERASFINSITGIEMLLGIFLPVVTGGLLSLNYGYSQLFLILSGFYLIVVLFPWKYNKKTASKLTVSEIVRITKAPKFNFFASTIIFISAIDTIFMAIMLIIPYIFLKSELKVGLLVSGVTFVSALFTVIEKKYSLKTRVELGYFGYFIKGIANLLLSIFWTTPMVIFRSMGINASRAISDTVYEKVFYDNREMILGDFRDESTAEMNLVIETLLLFSRWLGLGIFFIILQSGVDGETIIRYFVGIFGGWRLVGLFLQLKLRKKLQR